MKIWMFGLVLLMLDTSALSDEATPPRTTTAVDFLMAGLIITDEECVGDKYNRREYSYDPKKFRQILAERGDSMRSMYTGRPFRGGWNNGKIQQVEHIVATSEAHRSGLCRASRAARRAFAQDPENMVLSDGQINRQKSGKDAVRWIPPRNRCWFALTVVHVKMKYRLTVDRAEAKALRNILQECANIHHSGKSVDAY